MAATPVKVWSRKSSLSCKLARPPPPPAGPFKLFVRFPADVDDIDDTRVHSITVQPDSVSVTALKARIELLLGLPGIIIIIIIITLNFISELGRRICVHTGDARETSYLLIPTHFYHATTLQLCAFTRHSAS